jgi:SagB-type dehydrogenase family enzyme
MIPSDNPFALPLLYHLNSQAWPVESSPEEHFPVGRTEAVDAGPSTDLPAASGSSVVGLLRQRRSCRSYEAAPLSRRHLATLLHAAGGVVGTSEYAPGLSFVRQTAPSAGALFPLRVYAVVERVEGVDDGLYQFNALSNTLRLRRGGAFLRALGPVLLNQAYFDDANVVLVFAASWDPVLRKYGPRGYRYVLLEVGHASQNVCLVATELGLGSVCIGGFSDVELNGFLGLDGAYQAAIYCVGCGTEPGV